MTLEFNLLNYAQQAVGIDKISAGEFLRFEGFVGNNTDDITEFQDGLCRYVLSCAKSPDDPTKKRIGDLLWEALVKKYGHFTANKAFYLLIEYNAAKYHNVSIERLNQGQLNSFMEALGREREIDVDWKNNLT